MTFLRKHTESYSDACTVHGKKCTHACVQAGVSCCDHLLGPSGRSGEYHRGPDLFHLLYHMNFPTEKEDARQSSSATLLQFGLLPHTRYSQSFGSSIVCFFCRTRTACRSTLENHTFQICNSKVDSRYVRNEAQ